MFKAKENVIRFSFCNLKNYCFLFFLFFFSFTAFHFLSAYLPIQGRLGKRHCWVSQPQVIPLFIPLRFIYLLVPSAMPGPRTPCQTIPTEATLLPQPTPLPCILPVKSDSSTLDSVTLKDGSQTAVCFRFCKPPFFPEVKNHTYES